jgi:dihydrolipoamide dehydrogenase
VTVQAENKKGETITLEGDYSLVSVGRESTLHEWIECRQSGVKISDKGQVEVIIYKLRFQIFMHW